MNDTQSGRRFIHELGELEAVDQVFLLAEKQLRPNRAGNLYLQLRLSDRSGSIAAMMWNAGEKLYAALEHGDYVRVSGKTQFHNGNLQILVSQIERVSPATVCAQDFTVVSSEALEQLGSRLCELLRTIETLPLRNLIEVFLSDETFFAKYSRAPAGVKHHHAFPGGLLQHVVALLDLVDRIAPLYPQLDRDLLLAGAFLHDVGKIDEMTGDCDLRYTDEGQLIGHVVMGVGILERAIVKAEELAGEPFPADLALQLKHMIVSHHGQLEHGSPKLPMTREALTLSYLDDFDAKLYQFDQLIGGDVNSNSEWTAFHTPLGRKIYKGRRPPVAADACR